MNCELCKDTGEVIVDCIDCVYLSRDCCPSKDRDTLCPIKDCPDCKTVFLRPSEAHVLAKSILKLTSIAKAGREKPQKPKA